MYKLTVEVRHNLQYVSDVLRLVDLSSATLASFSVHPEEPNSAHGWRYRLVLTVDVGSDDDALLNRLNELEIRIMKLPGYIQLQSSVAGVAA